MPPMFKIKKKSGVLGTRKTIEINAHFTTARLICIFGQQNCIMHENSQDTLTTAIVSALQARYSSWRPLLIGVTNQALECT